MTKYRPIDLGGLEPVAEKVDDKTPDLEWIRLDQLVFDDTYQRTIEKRGVKNVQHIASNFDWGRFMPLLVSPIEDDRYAVIDGQHRSHAAALCGIAEVPAVIVPMSPAEQARAFSWVNGQVTAVTQFQLLKAAIAASEPWALAALDLCESVGCQLMTSQYSSSEKKPGQLFNSSFLKNSMADGKTEPLREVLASLMASVETQDPLFFGSTILRPLLNAAIAAKLTDRARLTDFLNINPLHSILHSVDRLRDHPDYFRKSRGHMIKESFRVYMSNYLRKRVAA